MQKLYLISENVPVDVQTKIEKLFNDLKENDIYSFLYCGYPLINIDNDKSFMKGLAITEKGIFILYQQEKEQTDATRDFIKNIILLTITSTMENEKISVNIPNNISINKNLIVQFINSISDAINKSPNKEYNGMVLKRALENIEIDKRIPRYVRIGR